MQFIQQYLSDCQKIISALDRHAIESAITLLRDTREKEGRLFILGVGGSAANAAHAVNDFRKIANIEAYAPTDNVAELTARINDNGFETIFVDWLKVSRLRAHDLLFILSVGGGSVEKNVSTNLVTAIQYAKQIGAKTLGIVGHKNGFTATEADHCIIIPETNAQLTTPLSEAFQAVIWHLLVSHPHLKQTETKWESLSCENI